MNALAAVGRGARAALAPWRDRPGLVALGVLAVMVVWRGVLLRDSFFNQDDYYLTARAWSSALDLQFLTRDTAGHLNPLQQLTYWVVSRWAPFEWGPVAGFVLVLQTLATVFTWHVLTRLLPGRWVRVPLLAVFALSPLTLATTLWWSAAMGLWPHVLVAMLAVLLLLRLEQGAAGPRWAVLGILVCVVVGVLWYERSVLVPAVLYGVAVALRSDVRGWRRLVAPARSRPALWIALVVVVGGFLAVHSALTEIEGGATSWGDLPGLVGSYLGRNVVPGLVSGPWQASLEGGAVVPATWVVVLSVGLVLLGGAWLLRVGGATAGWATVLLVGYLTANLVLLVSGRGGFGTLIALDPRYSADVVHVAVLAAALALREVSPGPRLRLLRGAPAALLATVVYVVGAAFGSAVLVPHFQNTEDRAFVTTLRAALAGDGSQVVYDDLVPPGILLPLLGEEALFSRVFAPLPEVPAVDEASSRLRVVGPRGRLLEARLEDAVRALPGDVPECGYAVGPRVDRVRFPWPVDGRLALHLRYFSQEETSVEARLGAWSGEFRAFPGPNEVWLVVPDTGRETSALALRSSSDATVCVTAVEAGRPVGP
ncbi:MAG: hypothetical protein Q8Q02_01245 [Nocardioides sp.]|nr:hypothetical protein [Nocardioides sp.]